METINNIQIESPSDWADYELIDSGDGYKLERFGRWILARPEPKALWTKSLSEAEWRRLAHTVFIAGAGFGKAGKEDSGTWERAAKQGVTMPDRWYVEYKGADCRASEWSASRHGAAAMSKIANPQANTLNRNTINLQASDTLHFKLRLGLTSFKHVGVFPEQASNWEWIYAQAKTLVQRQLGVKVLNLFAYTGAATLAARCAGASVTHVDSVKQVVTWGRENMELSGLDNVRWIIDDALKFVKREIRRGSVYNGLILDPPAYGHGPTGERWKLDELLFDLLEECSKIVAPTDSFTVLNLYSNGYSALLADTLLKKAFAKEHPIDNQQYSCGELVLKDSFGKVIPLSVFARMQSQPQTESQSTLNTYKSDE